MKGEPKRNQTEVLPLTSLTPYPYAKPAHEKKKKKKKKKINNNNNNNNNRLWEVDEG